MNRRRFLAAGATAMLPRVTFASGKVGANDRIRVGFIGAGGRGRWLMQYFGAEVPDAEIAAVADCYLPRCFGKDSGLNTRTPLPADAERWGKYSDYRKMLDKEKLDAVWIETTTHARALIAIHAMQAGLDVYAEKPISLTVEEGRALVKAARRYNRVFQAGSQQRSMPINRYASELVRKGRIGRVRSVIVCNYLPPLAWAPKPEEAVPDGLDWDAWCNQTELRPYHPHLQRRWSNWSDYDGGGQSWGVSGWGTHGLDQVQCALGADDTGPLELWTEDRETTDEPDFPLAKNPEWQPTLCRKPVMMRFAAGTIVRLEEPGKNSHSQLGGIFEGDNGRIQILRGDYKADPPEMRKGAPEVTPEGKGEDVFHLKNFVECIRTRKRPNADVEIAHRATTLCHLVNICRKLDQRLRWDPKAQKFLGDHDANALLSRSRRQGYELPRV